MSPEAAVDPMPHEVAVTPREAAIALARSGAPLTGAELRAIIGVAPSTFFYHQKRGDYDRLKMKLATGLRCYSGVLIARWLDGAPIYEPSFGRPTRERAMGTK